MMHHTDLQTSVIGITEVDPSIYESGQRRCGPPSNWTNETPAKGCEVFIAKIPKDCFEKDLIPVMRQVGEIFMFRLMMENEDSHRGFGFCIYTTPESAKEAVTKLNNYQIRKNWFLGICFSVDNCRLFVGGIPKLKVKSEIYKEISKVTDNVVDIIVYPSAADKNKNRGFAFVEYTDHKSAAVARKKMISNAIQLWGHNVAVDWAEPERKVDEETMSKVKILYIRNLMLTTSEEAIYQTCSKLTKDKDEIIRVKKIGDFAFVHFKSREEAEHVKTILHGTDLEGSTIEVHYAKPANKLEQQQKLIKRSNTSFHNILPMAFNNGMRKMSIESTTNGQLISPSEVDNSPGFKSYRNAAGRCSIKSKQIIKNIDQNSDLYFTNIWEVLTFICQNYGFGAPCLSVQMIPFQIPNNDMTLQAFVAHIYIPGLNFNFPSKVYGFTQEEAIISASECALQYFFYNGLQVPSLWGTTNYNDLYTNNKDDSALVDKDLSIATNNIGNHSESSLNSSKTGQSASYYKPQSFQYNQLGQNYSNKTMQPEDSNQIASVSKNKIKEPETANQAR